MLSAAIIVHLCCALLQTSPQPVDLQLQVVVREGAPNSRAELELTNMNSVPAVAWSVDFISADGRQSGMTQDNYFHMAGNRVDSKILVQGRPLRFPVALKSSGRLSDATVNVVAVVYADGTAVGDPVRIDEIFSRRRVDVDTWNEVINTLETLGKSPVTQERLRAAANDLDNGTGVVARSAYVRRMATINLDLVAGSANPDVRLRRLLETMRQYAEAARAHSARR